MSFDLISATGDLFQFRLLFKLFLLVLVLFYFVLTAIIYRQVSLMTRILESRLAPLIRGIAVLQMVAVGILFFLALILV